MKKNHILRLTEVVLVIVMILSICSCTKKNQTNDTPDDTASNMMNIPKAENKTQEDFNALMQEIFENEVTADIYTLSTMVKNVESFGINIPKDISFDSFSVETDKEKDEEELNKMKGFLARLQEINTDELTDYQRFAYKKVCRELEVSIESYDLNELYSPLAINNGWLSNAQIGMYEYIFDDEQDLINYHKLLETFPGIMESIPGYIQMQIDEYDYAPTDNMISESQYMLDMLTELENNPFIDGYDSKVDKMKLDKSVADKYKAENKAFVKDKLIPAFEKFNDDITEFYGSTEVSEGLYWADGGEEYYNYLLKGYGFDCDADEMFEYLYDKAVLTINAEIEFYYGGYDGSDIGNDINVPEKPQDMMADLVKKFTGEFPSVKNKGYNIEYLPKSMEIEGMLAYCVTNRLDDANALTQIKVNGDAVGDDQMQLYNTLSHEGFPGHMLHGSYYLNAVQYPIEGLITDLGYMEGWARFVENKSFYKTGIRTKDADFSKIDNDLNYTICGLYDVAVNGLGYDAEDLAGLMNDLQLNGDAEYAQYIIDSFCSDPGLYIPYSAGYWYTNDLIKEYKKANSSMKDSEIYEKYMSLGPTSFGILREYLLGE